MNNSDDNDDNEIKDVAQRLTVTAQLTENKLANRTGCKNKQKNNQKKAGNFTGQSPTGAGGLSGQKVWPGAVFWPGSGVDKDPVGAGSAPTVASTEQVMPPGSSSGQPRFSTPDAVSLRGGAQAAAALRIPSLLVHPRGTERSVGVC